jgi:hypothetical protein
MASSSVSDVNRLMREVGKAGLHLSAASSATAAHENEVRTTTTHQHGQRLGSMEVYEAAKNQEWIKVEVRSWRPILAPSAVRREPSVWAWSVDP